MERGDFDLGKFSEVDGVCYWRWGEHCMWTAKCVQRPGVCNALDIRGQKDVNMSHCWLLPCSIFIAKNLSLLILNIFILDVEQIELVFFFLPLYFSWHCGCL